MPSFAPSVTVPTVADLGPALALEEGYLVQETDSGLHACWNYGPGHAPHCLIVGTSGGGKTALCRWMILDLILTPGSKALYLGDGKGAESFLLFHKQPGVADTANKNHRNPREDPIVDMVETVWKETRRRYVMFSEAKYLARDTGRRLNYDLPPLLVLCIDDFMDWSQGLTDRHHKQVLQWLLSIAQEGREVNIHLWLATQAPYARALNDEGLSGPIKRQLKARIAMAGPMGLDDVEAKMAFNNTKAGDWLELQARLWNLTGKRRMGLGMFAIDRTWMAFRAPWIADPYHWETSDKDREFVLNLLPRKLHLIEGVS